MRDPSAEAQRWLAQADNDLAFAELAAREGFAAQACFVAQQAAERALKAVAYGSGERVVLGHSLVALLESMEGRFPGLVPLREQAGVLDQYYVATRYPDALAGGVPFKAFAAKQANEAVASARAFCEAARAATSAQA